jgi:hypothetical protein
MRRSLWVLGVLAAAVLTSVHRPTAGAAQASPPARYYGTVRVNNGPPPIGTAILAYLDGVLCNQTTVEFYGFYQVDLSAGCGPAGAEVTFVVGSFAAREVTYFSPGYFVQQDLSIATVAVPLEPGCTNVVLTWPRGTSVAALAAAVTPAEALRGVWRYDAAAGLYAGFAARAPQLSDLTTVARLEAVWVCVRAPATLTQPAP